MSVQGILDTGLKRIYVNSASVEHNIRNGTNLPTIRIWQEAIPQIIQAHSVLIRGYSEVRFSADEPGFNKAQVFIETRSYLTVVHEDGNEPDYMKEERGPVTSSGVRIKPE